MLHFSLGEMSYSSDKNSRRDPPGRTKGHFSETQFTYKNKPQAKRGGDHETKRPDAEQLERPAGNDQISCRCGGSTRLTGAP